MTVKGVNFNQGYEPDDSSLNLSGSGLMQIKDDGVGDAKLAAGLNGEGHITIIPINPAAVGQGTWTNQTNTSTLLNLWFYNSSGGNGDNCSFQVYLAKGTYTLQILATTKGDYGILDVDFDAAEVASFDLYSAATTYNVVKEQASITVTESGLKTLKLRVDGKHASSIGYLAAISLISLHRTA